MATTPALPAELWLRVLQNLQKEEDIPDLWLSCRHVCRSFKESAEAIMRENNLQKTFIRFDLGEMYDEEIGKILLDSDFMFDRLSEDKTQATFIITGCADEYKPEVRERLRYAVEPRSIESPDYEVQIRRGVNDGPIPGLLVDYEKLELSCDWREMFNVFYGEEQIYHRLLSQWTKDQEKWAMDMRAKMERGELDMFKMMSQALRGFAAGEENARKVARRARICKEMKSIGFDWDVDENWAGADEEEEEALKKLKDSRYGRSFDIYSDDEDEEEGEEEDEEESDSEDEWEDDDESDGEGSEAGGDEQ